MAGLSAQENGSGVVPIQSALSALGANGWPNLASSATALRSLGGTGLSVTLGPGKVHAVWLGWCPANDVVAYTMGAQEDLARFKAKGGSQQRNTDGGPRGELGNSG